MEIRNALKKIDNYLSVVQNLNKTILEEGTMAPDELKLMKKYLRGCIERIEEIEHMLNIGEEQPKEEVKETIIEEVVLQNIVTPPALIEVEIKPEMPELINKEETVSTEIHHIIIDPEQVRDEMVAEPEMETLQQPEPELKETIIETPQAILEETILESVTVTSVEKTTFQLVDHAEEEQIIGKEEKRTWADLWADQSEPLNNGLVSEESEEEEPLKVELMEAPVIAAVERNETPEAEAIKSALVSSWEEEKEEVETIVAFREETTVNDIIQTTKETGLFETFQSTTESVLVKSYSTETRVSDANDSDVMVAELEHKEPEFSVSSIFSQVRSASEERSKTAKTLSESIALNDKFIFVRELFGNQFNEYENALRVLDNMNSFSEAEQHCMQQFHGKFKWSDRPANAEKFFALLEKRFTS